MAAQDEPGRCEYARGLLVTPRRRRGLSPPSRSARASLARRRKWSRNSRTPARGVSGSNERTGPIDLRGSERQEMRVPANGSRGHEPAGDCDQGRHSADAFGSVRSRRPVLRDDGARLRAPLTHPGPCRCPETRTSAPAPPQGEATCRRDQECVETVRHGGSGRSPPDVARFRSPGYPIVPITGAVRALPLSPLFAVGSAGHPFSMFPVS